MNLSDLRLTSCGLGLTCPWWQIVTSLSQRRRDMNRCCWQSRCFQKIVGSESRKSRNEDSKVECQRDLNFDGPIHCLGSHLAPIGCSGERFGLAWKGYRRKDIKFEHKHESLLNGRGSRKVIQR